LSSKKGQIWSTDFITGAVMLTIILLLFMLSWNNLAVRWNTSNDYRQMQTDAIFASEALMTTPGYPYSWEMMDNISTINTIGLVNGRNELNTLKVHKLVESNSSYELVKQKLGVQRYDLGIRITDLEQETTHYEFGAFHQGLSTLVIVERMGMLNDTPVMVSVEVWK
jgi:hypothetical protein